MIPSTPRAALLAAFLLPVLALFLSPPSAADAQLGGLVRRARGAVEQRAEQRLEEELPYIRLPAPDFNDRILEVTEARLELLVQGFEAEVEFADRAGAEYEAQVRAHEAAMAEHERAIEAYAAQSETFETCVMRFDAQEAEARDANDARVEKALADMGDEEFGAYVEALALRGAALARDMQSSSGPPSEELMRRQQEYTVEVNAMQVEQARRVQLAMQGMAAEAQRSATEQARLEAACGPEPVPPTMPDSYLTGTAGVLSQRGARTARLTPEQYAIMRERVLYWASQNGRPTDMGFSDQEMAALSGQKDALERVLDDMRDADVPL